jgi:hypothetical protein
VVEISQQNSAVLELDVCKPSIIECLAGKENYLQVAVVKKSKVGVAGLDDMDQGGQLADAKSMRTRKHGNIF